jgi:hypothetical protein
MPPRKLTRQYQLWRDRLATIEPGSPLQELQRRFDASYSTVHKWVRHFGYTICDLRGQTPSWADWTEVDWRQSNVAIARALNVSRERVRQVRLKIGQAKVPARSARRSRAAYEECLGAASAHRDYAPMLEAIGQ